jgi:thermostable 8-oxoguanine DNA glycosylase
MKRTTPLRRNGTPCRKHWAAFQKAQGPTLEMRQEMKAKQPRRSLEDMKHECKRCNWTLEGNKAEFEKRLRAEIGDKRVDALEQKAGFFGGSKHPREWLLEQIRGMRRETAPILKALKALDGGAI